MKVLWGHLWPFFLFFLQPISGTCWKDWLLANMFFSYTKLLREYAFQSIYEEVFFKKFLKRDKQVIIEFRSTPLLPTSPSDIIPSSLGCAYLNIFWFWLLSNQTVLLAPTQTHNLEASLQWHLVQFNYNVLQSRKLFKGWWKLCIFNLFSWKPSEIYICCLSHIETW